MNKIKKILSFLMIVAVLVSIVPVTEVKASSANSMSSQMINFFKSTYEITDVNTLSPDEVRVYAVFISNFMKPGMFTVSDLKGGTDSAFVQQVGKMFFGESVSTTTLNTLVQLNTIVYNTIVADLGDDGKCNLYPNSKTDDLLTGKGLLKHMMITDPVDDTKTKDIDESLASTIYFGKTDRHVFMDLQVSANRNAFKILAAYSVDFILGVNGLPGMSSLYVDGFGNIWGAYEESFAVGDTTVSVTTEKSKLKLVMPACLNPIAFTSFANASIAGVAEPTQEDLKLPLNNAFAMGALLNTSNLADSFNENVVPYYNVIDYLQSRQDLSNILNIYGISSPVTSVLDSNSALINNLNYSANLKNFFENKSTTIYNEKGNTSTYIILANNMDIVKKKLEATTQNTTEKITSLDDYIDTILDYLYSTTKIEMTDVADTLYYFGDSSVSGGEWKEEFSDLGMLGASLFTNEDNSFYGTNARVNGLTTKLNDFYNAISSLELSTDMDLDNLINLKEAESQLLEVFTLQSDKTVKVRAVKGQGKLVYLLANLNADCSNYNELVKDIDKYNNPKNTIDIENVSQSVSALCYLIGATAGEYGGNAPGGDFNYKSPILFAVGDTQKEVNLGAISKASELSTTQITKSKLFGFIPNIWDDKKFYYSLTEKDYYVKSFLLGDYLYFDTTGWESALAIYPKTEALANNQVFATFNIYTLFSSHNIDLSTSMTDSKVMGKIGDKEITYNVNNFIADASNNWPGIFFGYLVDILQMDLASQAATTKARETDPNAVDKFDCYSFESSFLPSATINVTGGKLDITAISSESGVSTSDDLTMKEMQEDLVKKIYGIVSDDTNDYRNSWLKSTIDGILLTLHRSITGSWLSNMYTISSGSGSTYQGVVGYISTPALKDLSFTAWVTNNYMQTYAFALLIVAVALSLMVLLRLRPWRQGIGIFAFMCFALLLPNILISNTINISNGVTDSLFSNKFDFWAMTQHQQAITSLDNATYSKEEVIASTFKQAEDLYSSDAGVRIKWMSPKKETAFDSLYTSTNMSQSFATNLTIFKWLFSSFIYESEFIDNDPLATYVYRSYNSITNAGVDYYDLGISSILKYKDGSYGADGSDAKIANAKTIVIKDKVGKEVKTIVQPYSYVFEVYKKALSSERSDDYAKMFYAALIDDSFYTQEGNFASIYYGNDTSVGKINDINLVATWNPDFNSDSVALWGMGCSEINNVMFSKAEYVSSSTNSGVTSNLIDEIATDNIAKDDANKIAFLLNTESPYYYFYNTLKYRYGEGSGSAFKAALLDEDIYKVSNTELETTSKSANNTIRDFLDLEGLFTYMIPYLTVCNDYVYDWTSLNGTSVEAFDFSNPVDGEESTATDFINASLKKEVMKKVWNMYTPWVDQLNSLDIHNKRVVVGTKKVNIENTLNPSYYLLSGRQMIFSEADMVAKGYNISQLTDTEMRIQKVLENTYTDLMYLVNYYDMDDEVLLSAAAMYATFNFNKEFSQNSLLGESVNLYPQNFEMKNFNHDAFLRLALLNSSGETVFSEKDLFETVLSKTSAITGVLLIVEDVLAIILIPSLKLILLLMLLFVGLLICITCVIQPPEKLVQAVNKAVGLPTIFFMVASIVFANLISLMLGDGLTAYVGSQSMSIATNDPTITILLLIVLDVIYALVLLKLVKMLFESLKQYGMASFFAGVGLVTDGALGLAKYAKSHTIDKATNAVGNVADKGVKGTLGGIVGGMINGKDGAEQGLLNGLRGRDVLDSAHAVSRQKHNDKIALKRGTNNSGSSTEGNTFGSNVTSSIDSKASTYADTNKSEFKAPTMPKIPKQPEQEKEVKPKMESTALGRVLSKPVALGIGAVGGVKIAGQAIQAGAHKVNVGARVGGHFAKEGARVVGEGTVAGVKIAGKAVGKAYDYAAERGVGGVAIDGAKLAGKGAVAVGKIAAKPVVSAAKATGRYAYKSAQDAVALNKDMSDKLNTTHNNLYKLNHGYDLDIANKASGKTGDRYEQEKAQKIKRNFDNKNQGRANREACEMINKLESKRQ